jgi:hypothetical protein
VANTRNYFFLTVNDAGLLEVQWGKRNSRGNFVFTETVDLAGWDAFWTARADELDLDQDDLRLMCSSSLDFPEDYTDNPDTLTLCRALRG